MSEIFSHLLRFYIYILQTGDKENNETEVLKKQLSYITGLYERSESRISSLEEERSRLESETKLLERSIASAIHAPISSVHRQVRNRIGWKGMNQFKQLSYFDIFFGKRIQYKIISFTFIINFRYD